MWFRTDHDAIASVDFVEEIDELLKIYFVVRFYSCNLNHCYVNKGKVRNASERGSTWK